MKTGPRSQLPQLLQELYSENNNSALESMERQCDEITSKMKLTREEVTLIDNCTLLQSSCLIWHELRCGWITSSTVHGVLHTDPDNPSRSVIKQICFPDNVSATAINWGQQHERTALKAYTELLNIVQPPHSGLIYITIQRTDLRISQDKAFLGASADAIAQCSCHGKHIIEEMKYSFRSKTAEDFLGDKRWLHALVQLQMFVYGTQHCNFFV